jgi:hypothetical protein
MYLFIHWYTQPCLFHYVAHLENCWMDVYENWNEYYASWGHLLLVLFVCSCNNPLTEARAGMVVLTSVPLVGQLAMGWTVQGSIPSGGEIFHTHPYRPRGLPSLLHSGYRVFPEGKVDGAWCWPPTPSSAKVKERVELYLNSPSGPSQPVLGW